MYWTYHINFDLQKNAIINLPPLADRLLEFLYTFKFGEFIEQEEEFYNKQTFNVSKASVVNQVAKLASRAVGTLYYPAIKSGFEDRTTDLTTRISFKVNSDFTI